MTNNVTKITSDHSHFVSTSFAYPIFHWTPFPIVEYEYISAAYLHVIALEVMSHLYEIHPHFSFTKDFHVLE